jgi:hypothetical protein
LKPVTLTFSQKTHTHSTRTLSTHPKHTQSTPKAHPKLAHTHTQSTRTQSIRTRTRTKQTVSPKTHNTQGDIPVPWKVTAAPEAKDMETVEYSHDQYLELKNEADSGGKSIAQALRGGCDRLWGRFAIGEDGHIWSQITSDQALLYVSVLGGTRQLKKENCEDSPRASLESLS